MCVAFFGVFGEGGVGGQIDLLRRIKYLNIYKMSVASDGINCYTGIIVVNRLNFFVPSLFKVEKRDIEMGSICPSSP